MQSNFKSSLKLVLKYEGSKFTDDPDDRGGATRYGVIQTRYDEYRKDNNLGKQSVRLIMISEVEAIYARYYWNVVKGDLLPAIVDTVVFDAAVNHGPSRAAKWLQHLVGAVEDGQIGTTTIGLVNKVCADVGTGQEKALATKFCDRRENFYEDIAVGRQAKFLKGWMNRLQGLRNLFGLKDTDGKG